MLVEISVRSHDHKLVAVDLEAVYICDGCKEKGTGWRYSCKACNYDMHNFCATASPSIPHPLTAANMRLLSSPVDKDSLWCSACEKSVSGLRYYCSASGDALHPCCAHLPKTCTNSSDTLRLSKNLSSDPCELCGQRTRGWAYVSTSYSVHVHCLKEAWETPASNEFNLPSNQSPQFCNGPFQSIAAPSTSYHQHSEAAYTTPGTLQKYQRRKTSHRFKGFCRNTKRLLKAIYALFFGDPSSVVKEYAEFASNY